MWLSSLYADTIKYKLLPNDHKIVLKSQNWFTESLSLEIHSYAAKEDDVSFARNSNENIYNRKYFELDCNNVLVKNREFVNAQQLDEFSTKFLSNWNIFICSIYTDLSCCFKKSTEYSNNDNKTC